MAQLSISRFTEDCDVYVYGNATTGGQGLCCSQCKLAPANLPHEDFEGDWDAMLLHMERHREAGHKVPDEVWRFLEAEERIAMNEYEP